jgi:hypothetical protein
MAEKQEEVKHTTPIYTRNANKRYYEKNKQYPEYMAKLAETSKQLNKDNKYDNNIKHICLLYIVILHVYWLT